MISYIYYIYFIKKNRLGKILQGILRPTTSWRLIVSLMTDVGILVLLPSILFLAVKYLNLFVSSSSLLLNIIKLVTLVDISIVLIVGKFSVMLLPFLYLLIRFIKFPSENSSENLPRSNEKKGF